MNLKNTLAMTGAELQELLNKHCEEIRHELSGFLFYGIQIVHVGFLHNVC